MCFRIKSVLCHAETLSIPVVGRALVLGGTMHLPVDPTEVTPLAATVRSAAAEIVAFRGRSMHTQKTIPFLNVNVTLEQK